MRKALLLMFFLSQVAAWDRFDQLESDLSIIKSLELSPLKNSPVVFNSTLGSGYSVTPSARMTQTGEIGIGFSSLSKDYSDWNLRLQLFSHFELSASYRIFHGIDLPFLNQQRFGDFSDKGLNLKYALFLPEDSGFELPGLAIGWEDCLGTKSVQTKYIVLTQVIPSWSVELSLGYGWDRLHGWFGGIAYHPFRSLRPLWLHPLCLTAEYDPIDYQLSEKQFLPSKKVQRSKFNYSLKYRFFDLLDVDLSYLKGRNLGFSFSLRHEFGLTTGLLPKIDDGPIYTAPRNYEPIGSLRTEDFFAEELYTAFLKQGFLIEKVFLYYDSKGNKTIKLFFENQKYRLKKEVRHRLTHLLLSLLPDDIDQVFAVQVAEGMSVQEYHFLGLFLRQMALNQINESEMELLSPIGEVTVTESIRAHPLFSGSLPVLEIIALPRTHTYFDSAKGKFRYGSGINAILKGFTPWWQLKYQLKLSYLLFSYLDNTSDVDLINPSQLINVQTQVITYEKQRGLLVDEGYLQKNIPIGNGFFTRLALGYFNPMYAGAGFECLYYPVDSPFGIGLDGAFLKRRQVGKLGLTNQIRKLTSYKPTYVPFSGSQAFLDLYYDFKGHGVALELNMGKFLANDWGASLRLSRYFESGLRIFFWHTWTNGRDRVNGSTYFDKGVGFSMPLDLFLSHSSKSRIGYEMSAWLRDVGYRTQVGDRLYHSLYLERQ